MCFLWLYVSVSKSQSNSQGLSMKMKHGRLHNNPFDCFHLHISLHMWFFHLMYLIRAMLTLDESVSMFGPQLPLRVPSTSTQCFYPGLLCSAGLAGWERLPEGHFGGREVITWNSAPQHSPRLMPGPSVVWKGGASGMQWDLGLVDRSGKMWCQLWPLQWVDCYSDESSKSHLRVI